MKTLIQIQSEYVETVVAGMMRWGHRPDGGHLNRIRGGATKRLRADLERLGFTEDQIMHARWDAQEMAMLEFASV